MKSTEVKYKFRITNTSNLIAFLRKIKLVDKSVILELEGTDFFAKVRTADKSVIKYVSLSTFNFLDGELPKSRVKIGIMEIEWERTKYQREYNNMMDSFKLWKSKAEEKHKT